ncbi:MAG: FkbM family methyltransferase [Planctomycetes bacterium]|nr:FkbM family methyltransferase [Planctomycetota bacterium]
MTAKAHLEDVEGRIRDICADPCNKHIARVPNAGAVIDGHLITHNGLLAKAIDPGYVRLLQGNNGCHEPQEEFVFQEVLKHIPQGGSIVELGAYWAFYSMWFANEVAGAKCFCVEPRKKNLKVGKHNFAKNGLVGEFFHSKIGHGYLGVDEFLESQQLDYIDILHADIQGAEFEMLCDAEQSLKTGRIGYVFVGTHSQELHYQCKSYLERCGYITVAHADFDHGTYCSDGVLVARHKDIAGLEPLELPLRDAQQQREAERQMNDIRVDAPEQNIRSPQNGLLRRLQRQLFDSRR